jgi:hypothetical protein
MLAVAEQPARAADTSLPVRAAALVRDVVTDENTGHASPRAEETQSTSTAPASRRSSASPRDSAARDRESGASTVANSATRDTPRVVKPGRDRAENGDRTGDARAAKDPTPIANESPRPAPHGKTEEPKAAKAGARIEQGLRETDTTAATSRDEAVSDDRLEQPLDYAMSAYAGVFHLLPLLRRLGAGEWLAARPHLLEREFVARLLRHIAQCVGAPPDDAMFAALPVGEIDQDAADELAPLLAEWTTALRRWCRHNAQTGLVAIVRRNGKLSTTRTHLDVYFSLRQLDLRIRKAGLDVDPGWLPWFGRVVTFHYEAEGWRRG